ncbi:uncharacterized protein LOC117168444 [Belonocnema kinseyi]|uniref:uncharacterized protein LOC117168444 n=1 Tax=Belonocnema kinseyi TaxID=2817044 RepID=UPI00143D4EBA|nr:uncharacterized protein LOC117168444 [Belonocnema kinseyi]XP_033209987.1 uncharacterized protein LOC117168444 [Belonocnema kinseyi]
MSAEPQIHDDVSKNTFLDQNLCQNVSFKSLPALETQNSLDEIRRLRRHSAYQRRNILRSFVKAIERRPKRRLNQNKACADRTNQDLSKKSSLELNIHTLRNKLTKEKSFANFNIQKLGTKIKSHFKKGVCEPQFSVQKEAFLSEKGIIKSICHQNNNEAEKSILKAFQKLNIDEAESKQFELLIKPGSMEMSDNCTGNSESTMDSSGSHIFNSESSGESEKPVENKNGVQTLYTQRQMDFSSGDDVQNCATFQSDANCETDNLMAEESENLGSRRRSVQWNGEVDVVYYAGDSDGGKVLGREREPLREEDDQQARHKRFIEFMVMKQSLLSNAKAHFLDYWLFAFPK